MAEEAVLKCRDHCMYFQNACRRLSTLFFTVDYRYFMFGAYSVGDQLTMWVKDFLTGRVQHVTLGQSALTCSDVIVVGSPKEVQ